MKINPIMSYNSNRPSFNANVHMDLRVAEAYKNDKTLQYLVDTLKSPKVKYSDVYLSIIEKNFGFPFPSPIPTKCLNAQTMDPLKNTIVDYILGHFERSYKGNGLEFQMVGTRGNNNDAFNNQDSFVSWLNSRLSLPN